MLTNIEFVAGWLRSKAATERGASLVEYALLLSFIAMVCVAAVGFLGGNVSNKFSSVGNDMNSAN